jgi:Na+/melibiose symporter-like transporter
MQRPRMLWADIGMAVAVGVFVAIVMLFHGESAFTVVISTYVVALIAWTLFCEWAVTRADAKQAASTPQASSRAHNSPIPH